MIAVERRPLAELGPLWTALAARARTDNAFVSWPFLATWWEHFRRTREERVFVVTDGGAPIAIAPLYVQERRTRCGPVRELRLLGQGDVVNPDFLDLLVVPGREDDVARALAAPLLDDRAWDYAEFSELAGEGSLVRIVRSWERDHGVEIEDEPRSTCPYIPLPGSFDDFLMSCNPHFRQQLRRYRRVIERELAPEWKQAGTDVDVETGIELLGRLHQERMEATERGGNFRKDDYAAFHRALAVRMAEAGELYFWLLFLEGRPAAAHYGFLHGGVYYGYQMGFTHQYAKYSPGHYMTGVVIEKLIEKGARELNLLRGTDAWKFRWTEAKRETRTVRVLRPTLRSRFARRRAGLAQPPALALRYLVGRDAFEELRQAVKRLKSGVSESR